jgi:serine/threonine protein kinase
MSAKNEEVRALKPSSLPLENLVEHYVGKAVDVRLPKLKSQRLKNPVRVHGYECRSLLGKTGISATLLCIDEDGISHVLKIPAGFYDWKVHSEPVGKASMYGAIGKEAKALEAVAGLNHPCVVKFERFLEASGDDPPALVFEFCEGGSLADLLEEQGRLDPVTAVEIIVQVADALAAIHELGYAHGDVKPNNILFSRDRIPRLADFNSARAVAATTRSVVPLTYGYAAPEHVKTGRLSQKGDIWSLALVLYEAVAGKNLFPLLETEYVDELARLERSGKVKVQTGDDDLDSIIEKCIKVNPDERPSMRELEEMLFAYLERRMGRREKEIKAEFERKIGWLKRRERKERKREELQEELEREAAKELEKKERARERERVLRMIRETKRLLDLLEEKEKSIEQKKDEISSLETAILFAKAEKQEKEVEDLKKRKK